MKKLKTLLIVLTLICFSHISFGQTSDRNFGNILQSYYLYKDKDIVDKTIDFVNHTPMTYSRLEPILTGFFGALFSNDTIIRKSFIDNFDKIEKSDIKDLFVLLSSSSIDTIYSKYKITPAYNDMNWSSYFATGNTKYLDNIISNIKFFDNRIDINLFLAGSSAKWSLCSNATQDEGVKKYLNLQKLKNKNINEILHKEPQYFKDEMVDILKNQKVKGVWN